VNLEDKNEVLALDPKKLEVVPGAPGTLRGALGLAIDVRSRRLFVGCANKLMAVVRTNDGHVVTTLIGEGTDAVAFDPDRGLAFSSNRDGTLTVVKEESPDSFRVLQNLETRSDRRPWRWIRRRTRCTCRRRDSASPAPTADRPHPRPTILPGHVRVLVVSAPSP